MIREVVLTLSLQQQRTVYGTVYLRRSLSLSGSSPLRTPVSVCFTAAATAEAGMAAARGSDATALASTVPGVAPR
jgi:hypothetical protein